MTEEKLQLILQDENIGSMIGKLSVSSFDVPKWSDLERQYEPKYHSIMSTAKYPIKLNENGVDEFKRTPLAYQKLAVNRIAQSAFVEPVTRSYSSESEAEIKASEIIENIYSVKNNIDSENIERSKKLFAACEIVTYWFTVKRSQKIKEETSEYSIQHRTYSSMDGYNIYANVDEYGYLLYIGISYKDSDNREIFDLFLNTEIKEYRKYIRDKEWKLSEKDYKRLDVFPCVHTMIKEPVWGGEDGTKIVEQLEEMESFDGLYIHANSAPVYVRDKGDISGMAKKNNTTHSDDNKNIIDVGKGGGVNVVVWDGATESKKQRFERLKNTFFEMNQFPDTSFSSMLKSNMSAENREFVFADCKAKALDLGGELIKFFSQELDIIKELCSVIYPKYKTEFENLSIKSKINPFQIRSKKENSEYVATAGDSMSLKTKIRILNEVEDVQAEEERILNDKQALNNQGIEPL